jgi:hypothetical protein
MQCAYSIWIWLARRDRASLSSSPAGGTRVADCAMRLCHRPRRARRRDRKQTVSHFDARLVSRLAFRAMHEHRSRLHARRRGHGAVPADTILARPDGSRDLVIELAEGRVPPLMLRVLDGRLTCRDCEALDRMA